MRSRRAVISLLLAAGVWLAAHALAPVDEVEAESAARPAAIGQCASYSPDPVPTTFAGCAELEALASDPQAFMGEEGFRLDEYEKVLDPFFRRYCYRNPETGWRRDKRVRDTGPYSGTLQNGQWVDVAYHGTHMPVVIWYNPTMLDWMAEYRPAEEAGEAAEDGEPSPVPDGAFMVKEMYAAPAARCASIPPEHLVPDPGIGLAFMVRDRENAHDGWFWGAWWPGFTGDWPASAKDNGNGLPYMGYGLYCLNCHASAENDATFADLKNVEGEAGRPNVYLSQNFLFESSLVGKPDVGPHRTAVDTSDDALRHATPLTDTNPAFARRFPDPGRPIDPAALMMPSQTYDHVWVETLGPTAAAEFVTSDQCIGCHDAGSTGLQFDMTAPDPTLGALLNLSPYGSWRSSPMGLGGRDPIFFAQLASESQTFHPDQKTLVQDVCLGCHGVMGQRQFKIDRVPSNDDCDTEAARFTRPRVDAVPYPSSPGLNPQLSFADYGALARDGISCAACHRMALTEEDIDRARGEPENRCVEQRQDLLNPEAEPGSFARTFTGSYWVTDPGRLLGPFADPKVKPMEHALGIEPVLSGAVASSELCGSCHTVHLPIFDGEETLGYTYEQTTYPEWAFSAYRTGLDADGGALPEGAGARAQSCQTCHMKHGEPSTGAFRSKIASIQEFSNFPATDNVLGPEDIDLEVRSGFARHTLVGLNVFLVEMAQQFPAILGLRTQDPMLGAKGLDPVLYTERAMLRQAATETATVAVHSVRQDDEDGRRISARVEIDSKVGHKLPSGVGFRRAFLAFEVLDAWGRVLWASGRTDGAGVIVDQQGEPIDGELWWTTDCSERLPGTPHQPHYQRIERQDQAQIYQELVTSPAPVADPQCGYDATPGGQLTTSFLSICGHVKDNRILPHGFLDFDARVAISRAFGAGPDLAEDSGPYAVGDDPHFVHGGGDALEYVADLTGIAGEPVYVRATLYYQAIPPFYLQDRFCTAQGPDRDRLYYLSGHLDLEGTKAEDWKLQVVGSGLVEIDPQGRTAVAARR